MSLRTCPWQGWGHQVRRTGAASSVLQGTPMPLRALRTHSVDPVQLDPSAAQLAHQVRRQQHRRALLDERRRFLPVSCAHSL